MKYAFLPLFLLACAGDPTDSGADPEDSGEVAEGPENAPPPWASITGDCGAVSVGDLTADDPSYFRLDTTISAQWEEDELTPGGAQIAAEGNLGGSSLESEILSYELLFSCEGAALLKTESTVVYATEGKKTDLLVEIEGIKLGVSVTRAVKFPHDQPYTTEDATNLLSDKLADILESSENVAPEDAWEKQMLAVIAYDDASADSVRAAWDALDAAVKADTVMFVAATDGADDFLY